MTRFPSLPPTTPLSFVTRRSALFTGFCAVFGLVALHAEPTPVDPQGPIAVATFTRPIRVSCVGDSITAGVGTAVASLEAYPVQLGRMLGQKWQVTGLGVSGSTLLNNGDRPYQKQSAFQSALTSKPDVILIKLGTNDTKPQNWKFKDQFIPDYKNMVDQFRALDTKPRIFICLPATVPGTGNFGINEAGVQEQMPLLREFAKKEGLGIIDMHGALEGHDEMLPDRVHPNTAGAGLMARAAYRVLTGADFKGELPPYTTSQWNGYEKRDFAVNGRASLIVIPKTAAPGKPWIWRTEFFGAFPSADIALLEKGWHVVYTAVPNLYGSPTALDAMDKFYDFIVKEYQLAPKTVPEGFSRGGLYAINWAARNPTKVAAIYVDAPVCDFKSWPGGKGKGKGAPANWTELQKVYGFKTEDEALAYKGNPIDNLEPLAKAKIPIISVCGDADTTVPIDENTRIVEQRYKTLGGEITVIAKPGVDHHPHSLTDPQPIVDFLLAHGPK